MPTREDLLAAEAERLRGQLLRAHRHRASPDDLQDILAQSVLEVLLRIRRDPTLATPAHIANTLQQRFESRLSDHYRAIGGRSPSATALAHAARIDDPQGPPILARADVEREVLAHEQLREVLHAVLALSPAQRAALLAEALGRPRTVSTETNKKRLQRARLCLRAAGLAP